MSSDQVVTLLNQVLARLTVIEGKVNGQSGSEDATAGGELPRSIKAYDEYCALSLDPFVAACTKLGGDAAEAGTIVKEAWVEMRAFLIMASQCKEPPQTALSGLLGNLSPKLKAASALVKRNEWEKHTKTVSEGIGCLSWLCVKPAPRDFIESYIGGSDYWANGIRKEYRTTNPDQVAFCDTFKNLLKELMTYVKDHHTTGVKWNPNGVDVSQYDASSAAAAAPVATTAAVTAAAPAPAAKPAAVGASKADLFASLNREGAVTSGLKKVTKDQQTWRAEYAGGSAPAPPKPAPAKPAGAAGGGAAKKDAPKHPPSCDFNVASSRWNVEYQTADQGVVEIAVKDKKETVYVFGCVGARISVVGKCKSLIVDGCKKTSVTFQCAMASCEVVNCQRMQVYCTESVPSVAVDKTDGIVITLPRASLDTTVVASKSSEMNLSWPDENGDMVEKPIPEQYIHRIQGMAVTAEVSDLYG